MDPVQGIQSSQYTGGGGIDAQAQSLIAEHTDNVGLVQIDGLVGDFLATADGSPELAADLYKAIGENLSLADVVRFEQGVTQAYEARAQAAEDGSSEGIGSFFEGAIAGDFSDNDSWSKTGGQVAAGFVPVWGQIADARDTAAAIGQVWNGEEGGWLNLGAAAIGWVPGFGDGIKAAIRGGDRVVAETAEQAIRRADDAAEAGLRNADTVARVSSRPEWLQRLDAGNEFNALRRSEYPNNEVYIVKPDGSTGYYRLDSYNPATGEIVSRKFTQLADINESTARSYINEIAAKYPVGAEIADVPTSGDLAGQLLQGQYILEVPVQNSPIPQAVLDAANEAGVLIRDIEGKVY